MLPSNLPFKIPYIHLAEKGSRYSFRGDIHGVVSFHGCFRGSSGYRSTSPSPCSREEALSSESSAIRHPCPTPMDDLYNEIPERTAMISSTKHAPTARRARPSTATIIKVVLHVRQPKRTNRSRATPCLNSPQLCYLSKTIHKLNA